MTNINNEYADVKLYQFGGGAAARGRHGAAAERRRHGGAGAARRGGGAGASGDPTSGDILLL